MLLIERIGQKRIGFHCWKLFIINSFRGYEVMAILTILTMINSFDSSAFADYLVLCYLIHESHTNVFQKGIFI